MASTISANSAGGGGLVSSGDASGVLALQTAGVTALSIDASQKVTFANSLTSPTLTSPTLTSPIIAGTPSGVGTLTLGTVQASTSGTVIDFTGIPSWVKRITVMFSGVSTSGASYVQIQLGTGATAYTITGYLNGCSHTNTSTIANALTTTGFGIETGATSGAYIRHGSAVFTNISGNLWAGNGTFGISQSAGNSWFGGSITLAAALTAVRITTANGTDTFDAGSINIMYE